MTLTTIRVNGKLEIFGRNTAVKLLLKKAAAEASGQRETRLLWTVYQKLARMLV